MIASKHIPPMLHVIYSGPALGFSSRRTLVTTSAASTGSFPIPGRWLGPSKEASTAPNTNTIDEPAEGAPRYGLELTADEWNPLGLPLQPSTVLAANMGGPGSSRPGAPGSNDSGGNFGDFLSGDLPKKLALLLGLLVFSRLGVYVRLPGVDVDRFAEAMSGSGLLGYIDTLSGGSISKVGVFSLGIVPYINASILLQLLSTAFPSLKKLQREEGPQGRARFTLYQKLAALVFAVVQAVGQLTYIRPYVDDWSGLWLFDGVVTLTAGAVILLHVADTITELKLGNGTSVLIFANIASALPSSVGGALTQASTSEQANLAIYAFAFFLTTLGIVYVQDAERQIPMTYASRYRAGSLQRQAYLPFKVNATGVMPVIFSSSLLALPSAAARYINTPAMDTAAKALAPGGAFYLPTNVALIVAFNYLYTFLQLDPKELSEQLKRQGASVPGVRPGRNTAEFITKTLDRMSVLGSGFLGALAAAPALVEATTGLQAFRGFAGTSVLILVGVATDTARKFRAEIAMQKYGDIDKLYDDMK
ncbi:putative Preprotein translocase subunit SECY, chloroplastic [Nannochloris sp. 'desiccata']|nr:putative Preprotein translocase subunit SECY, chloroplastic [Chlorella desiccata (nom. nud.)]